MHKGGNDDQGGKINDVTIVSRDPDAIYAADKYKAASGGPGFTPDPNDVANLSPSPTLKDDAASLDRDMRLRTIKL